MERWTSNKRRKTQEMDEQQAEPPRPPSESSVTRAPWTWRRLDPPEDPRQAPCQRSLHVAAVWRDSMFIIGGYDGNTRVNDFFRYDFRTKRWEIVPVVSGEPPSPRDRHTAVVYRESFYVFGGFDGTARVQDFHCYSFVTQAWSVVQPRRGAPPTPRHSHATVVHENSMYCFGGYDGSYQNDFHRFDFDDEGWAVVEAAGEPPRARYRASCVVTGNRMCLFGGHDGAHHLNDVHLYDFDAQAWSMLAVEGPPPKARDSHVAVAHGKSMYVFGGSTGSAMNDFHELHFDARTWRPVQQETRETPGKRFCHVAVVYQDSLFIFGGYDGENRLNDFQEFYFGHEAITCDIPSSTLALDLRERVGSADYSDVTFLVEGRAVHAHKVFLSRCTYFRAMLGGEMREAREKEIVIPDVRHSIFLVLLEYLYTDAVEVPLEIAMELFEVADRFGVERLKLICESKMLGSINTDNAATIFLGADQHHAASLREKCLSFILTYFDEVTKTASFEEMARSNVELVLEILKSH
eukprot:g6180.t1